MRCSSGLARIALSLATIVGLAPTVLAVGKPGDACTSPTIRKEWRSLTKAEQANWISAVKCLANLPVASYFQPTSTWGQNGIPKYNKSSSLYDDFVYMHIDLAAQTHATGLFLPWHRWYVQTYEDTLRARCNLTTPSPYWDWRLDSKNVKTSPIFVDVDPESGIGGWGTAANDFQLTEGAFAKGFHLSYPSYHGLRRNYTETLISFGRDTRQSLLGMITPPMIDKLIKGPSGNFTAFQIEFEKSNGAHVAGHFLLGGDLAGTCPANAPRECANQAGNPLWSANEPFFWLHHGMVDKVWADFQLQSDANAKAFAGGSVQSFGQYPTGGPPMLSTSSKMPSDNMGPAATVGDVLSTTGGFLCYKYQ